MLVEISLFIYYFVLRWLLSAAFLGLFFFALFGIDSGIHRKYINGLLSLFERCRKVIEEEEQKKSHLESDDECEDESSQVNHKSPFHSFDFNIEPHEFNLSDCMPLFCKGIHDVIDDEVTKRFDAEELRSWNLLTRTNKNYQFTTWRITLLWVLGFYLRFYLLFPIRVVIASFGMIFLIGSTALIGLLPNNIIKRWIYSAISITAFRILSRSVSAVINFHNKEYRPKNGGICVANHTSPFDVVILHCDIAYAMVGQLHGGYLGVMERALSRATSHIFFDRAEATDRLAVVKKMKDHIADGNKLPIIIFPEGTCINNSAVMMFKKGSFEVASTVYPVAIKYDPRFGDAFWNSSKYGFSTYLLRMMTSWAIVCDVYYLPPMTRKEDEPAVDFANRVKAAIARKGGLVDMEWDGQLKRSIPRPELKQQAQKAFSRKISVRSNTHPVITPE